MAISDRIAVMSEGVIQQIGTPKALYQRPRNNFVATFIGRTNTMAARVFKRGGSAGLEFNGDCRVPMTNLKEVKDGQEVLVSVRPEELVILGTEVPGEVPALTAAISYSTFLGLNTHYIVELGDGLQAEIIQESQIDDIIKNGTVIKLGIKPEKVNVFTRDGSQSLIQGV